MKKKYQKTITLQEKETNTLGISEGIFHVIFISNRNDCNFLSLNEKQKHLVHNLLSKKNFDPLQEKIEIASFINENQEENKIAIIGINCTEEKKNYETIKNNFSKAINFIQSEKIIELKIEIANSILNIISTEKLAEILQQTILLKLYQFNLFISDNKKQTFTDFQISLIIEKKYIQLAHQGIKKGLIIGNSINFSRLLSDLPAKELHPHSFIDFVKNELNEHNIKAEITIFDKNTLDSLGMEGILGVGAGSTKEPALLILKYTPIVNESTNKTVALVGKGITFDTGGISIKPSDGMEDMKSDMSGAATVLSSFIGLAQLKTPYTLYAITPLAENMVDGNSIRPGDILTFYNGKTAEIKNTDAEGRLVLADALSYTCDKIKPHFIIDLATLTGACRIALGPVYAGLMTENNLLSDLITAAGEKSGDRCWRLPLEKAYEPNMHSDVADICNIGTKGYKAGATMGGMFLREFVDANIPWAHIDIAPVATDCPFKNYITSFGATGFGVGLLIELLESKKYIL